MQRLRIIVVILRTTLYHLNICMTGNRLNFLGEIRARKLPGLVVHFSEAQQGKVFEKIAKQSSRRWLRGDLGRMGNRDSLSGKEGVQTKNNV
jgi:hypothetical protein